MNCYAPAQGHLTARTGRLPAHLRTMPGSTSGMTSVKKTDLEKNKGLKINNSMKQYGANRAGSLPKGGRRAETGKTGLLGKLLGKAVPPEKAGD
ncbi:hypothetical protein ACUXQ2_002923 [Cupriavidus metallidurans]